MRYWMRFWLFVTALLAGLAAIFVVVTASFVPDAPYADLGTSGYAAAFAVIGVSVGIILWRATDENGLF